MYRRIDEQRSVRKLYTESLVKRGDITLEEAEQALDDFQARLQAALDETRQSAPPDDLRARPQPPPIGVLAHADTGVDRATVDRVYEALSTVPDGFTVHPKLANQFAARDEMFAAGEVDWALGEALAFGSLLAEGDSVRLAGQDSRRGTFSHRHSTLVDYETGEEYLPLSALATEPTRLWIYDSLLSEYAALGFEYGYSVDNNDALVMWEAQFGDFMNGAQIIIDQFLVAAEDKWNQTSGLVLLLPHGFEGQGPEHSSGRIERFLILAAEDNIQVANATTAAQYFHLLRRQMVRDVRKPLVVFTPKSLLRARSSRSPVDAFTSGTLPGGARRSRCRDPAAVRRVVLCSGKVGVDAISRARRSAACPVAIVRVEQLYPWPYDGRRRAPRPLPDVPASSCGCRRSRRTWAPGTSSRAACSGRSTDTIDPADQPGRVGQPGHRLGRVIHAQEQDRAARPGLRTAIDRAPMPGPGLSDCSAPWLRSGSVTLIVNMPIAGPASGSRRDRRDRRLGRLHTHGGTGELVDRGSGLRSPTVEDSMM